MKQTLKIGAMLLVVAALVTTGVALAQAGGDTTVFQTATEEERPVLRDKIVELLAPLVDDGVINQSQAEAVADTLAESLPRPQGPMARGIMALREAADFLEMTPQEVVEAVRDGQTLAEIAADNGSSGETLIEHLVGLAEDHLDELVADGRITEEQKADRLETMTDHITDLVNGEIERPFAPGPGHGGMGRHMMGQGDPDSGA